MDEQGKKKNNNKKQRRAVMRTAILAILIAAIGYTIYNSATAEDVSVLKVGDKAPDFALVDLEGNNHKLSDYEGQGVFLNFWGTWCKPCAKEMPAMDRQFDVFSDQGVQVLAVNIAQSDFEVQSFADQYGLSFPVVIDKTKSVMTAYNIRPLPTTVLVNPEGNIQRIITGEMTEQDIEGFMEEIKPD
ncbi:MULTISPECIES: thiol-disulfide oxidoreductase ResA [Planococcus]|uniref:Thiol-disulfide oxidoreductase n=2 Tax=Planococcus TaxID=1372 RepID=A0ABN4JTV4_9BACL|nr:MULTISPECIES: thiol-disulfide oxidoreductase ResA [Planococcus]ALS78353.1 thiol-disulfide oxidoreductase [Planococcus kocurii]AQU79667.1 thiol-disulfide oxidoreductase [Planococcus faecalis]KAA0958238.1 thiol-disulfide oxidoreductase ResA [Planococcus sp. ANT_H30]MDJ0331697.1 thiol-disulfide oxidoreductase ResA [Planococcus sp. S3-L1]OHX51585.1 thiol-disulfide oxidoreductase [Planococcus faecalis]